MKCNGAVARPGHPRVTDAHHIHDADLEQFHRDGQITTFRHAGRSFGARAFQHQDARFIYIEFGIVHALLQVVHALEYYSAPLVFHQMR